MMPKPNEDVTSFLYHMIQQVENEDVEVRQFRNGLDTIQDLIHQNVIRCSQMLDDWDRYPDPPDALFSEYHEMVKHITYAIAIMGGCLPGQEKTDEQHQTDKALDAADLIMEGPSPGPTEDETGKSDGRTSPVYGSKVEKNNVHAKAVDAQMAEIDTKISPQSKNTRRS
jgi:hypothetical protein